MIRRAFFCSLEIMSMGIGPWRLVRHVPLNHLHHDPRPNRNSDSESDGDSGLDHRASNIFGAACRCLIHNLVSIAQGVSRVGVIRPPGVGIFRPLERAPNAISKRVAEVAILQHEWGPLEAPFWTLARPSDHGMRGRRVRCNMRCGVAGPAWPRRAAGWWQTRGPIRQSPGCW